MSSSHARTDLSPRLRRRLSQGARGPSELFLLALLVGFVLASLAICRFAFAGTRDAALTWTAPTLNTDGTPAQITGYRIWRKGPKDTAFVAIATLGLVTAYRDATPPPGQIQYAVSAIGLVKDATGKLVSSESSLSNPVAKKIRLPAPTGGRVLPAPTGGVVLPSNP